MNKHYWLLEYWTGTIGHYDTFLVRKTFQSATAAISWGSNHAYKQKFDLRKVIV